VVIRWRARRERARWWLSSGAPAAHAGDLSGGARAAAGRRLTAVDIVPLELDDDAALDATYEVALGAAKTDLPDEPPPGRREHRAHLSIGWGGEQPVTWLALVGGHVQGYASLTLPSYDNPHLGEAVIVVHPDARRRGVGTALARQLQIRVRAAGRRLVIGETLKATPGPAFAAALGAECALVEVRRVLDLTEVDEREHERLAADARWHATGYRLLRWSGAVPAEYLDDMARLLTQMSDAPVDDLEWDGEVWTPERVRRAEEGSALAGDRTYTVAACHEASGRLIAFTSVFIREAHPWWSSQGATLVMPEHRGRRLGLLVKLAMLPWLRELEPEVRELVTGNAGSNGPMIAINEALGYRIRGHYEEWQLAV
jgi:RimJ/RimL family protein N-acetyltransferase